MAGKTEYKNKWESEHRERISLVVPKGSKAAIKPAADKHASGSVTAYIKQAINEKLTNDGFDQLPEPPTKQDEQPE